MATVRVQKILAQAGIASRRKAEQLILEGSVTINGQPAKLGDRAEIGKDAIKVRGKLILQKEAPVYLAFYKPKGVISMMVDPEGRATLFDYLHKIKARVFPVGRLDFNSEGLLLLTNDGDFAERYHRDDSFPRIYHVKVKGHPDAEMLSRLDRPARLSEHSRRVIKPHSIRQVDSFTQKASIEAVFIGGGAVDVKAFFESKGFLVEKVTRTGIGHITLHGLAPGEFRFLKDTQVEALLKQPELGLTRLEQEAEVAREKDEARAKWEARREAHAEERAEAQSSARGETEGGPIRVVRPQGAAPARARTEGGDDRPIKLQRTPRGPRASQRERTGGGGFRPGGSARTFKPGSERPKRPFGKPAPWKAREDRDSGGGGGFDRAERPRFGGPRKPRFDDSRPGRPDRGDKPRFGGPRGPGGSAPGKFGRGPGRPERPSRPSRDSGGAGWSERPPRRDARPRPARAEGGASRPPKVGGPKFEGTSRPSAGQRVGGPRSERPASSRGRPAGGAGGRGGFKPRRPRS